MSDVATAFLNFNGTKSSERKRLLITVECRCMLPHVKLTKDEVSTT